MSPLGPTEPEAFFDAYWGRRPLLVRGTLTELIEVAPSDHTLFAQARRTDVESRLIITKGGESDYELDHGPFEDLATQLVGDATWTLLLNGAERLLPAAEALLRRFEFLPPWLIDDVMISTAGPQGSVGPHVDRYDAFLIQVAGRRKWSVETTPRPRDDLELIEHADLAVLRTFHPDVEWTLAPGDMLYIPAGLAHYGVGPESCQTWSVGTRLPAMGELLDAFATEAMSGLDDLPPWGGASNHHPLSPDRAGHPARAELDPAALDRVRQALHQMVDRSDLGAWLGPLLTTPRSTPSDDEGLSDAFAFTSQSEGSFHSDTSARSPSQPTGNREGLIEHGFDDRWTEAILIRPTGARIVYQVDDEDLRLFFDGEAFVLPAVAQALIEAISTNQSVPLQDYRAAVCLPAVREALLMLIEGAHLSVEYPGHDA